MKTHYNVDKSAHNFKMMSISKIIEMIQSYKATRALIMPCTTFQSEDKFFKKGILNPNTKLLIFERGIIQNGHKIEKHEYRSIIEPKLKSYCHTNNCIDIYDDVNIGHRGIYYGELKNPEYHIDINRPKDKYFDFGFYDTCSIPTNLEWIPRHMEVYKQHSPILFTFVLDEYNRNKKYIKENDVYQKYADMDYFEKRKTPIDFSGVERNDDFIKKISCICSYLNDCKLYVKYISVYKEPGNRTNNVMAVFYTKRK